MRKKEVLAKWLDNIFPPFFLLKLRSFFINEITVLAYHRVIDVPDEVNYHYDLELVSASCKQFESQVKYLKKHYNPVSIEQLVDFTEGKIKLPKRPVLITFDDGFLDNYENAFPILKRHNVPAVIYISTGYMGSKKIIWFDWLVSLVKVVDETSLNISELDKNYILGDIDSRNKVATQICSDLKLVENDVRLKILSNLNKKYKNVLSDLDVSQSQMMSWDNVREMDGSCVSFGSHTVSHPILSQLTGDELCNELEKSKDDIEINLGHKVDTISYPVGDFNAFNQRVIDATKKAGYKLGFSYISGKDGLPLKNIFNIKRLHVERYCSDYYFRSMLCFPKIFKN